MHLLDLRRAALDSDHYITGKFEFGDSSHEAPPSAPPPDVQSGLGEVLSGGISAMPTAGAAAERQRTKEAQRIIGLVEPTAPEIGIMRGQGSNGSMAALQPPNKKDCTVQ